MPTKQDTQIRRERIAAYEVIRNIFPTGADMARELGLDARASVSAWGKRGVPIEYIMVLDTLGLVRKEDLLPSVKNWDLMFARYEKSFRTKLNTILLRDSLGKSASTALQDVVEPLTRQLIGEAMTLAGLLDRVDTAPLIEAGFLPPEHNETADDVL